MPFRTRARWPRGTRYQPAADLSASPSAFASSGVISTTSRPPPSSGTRMTMPRPSLVTSSGPSPVRGFMAAMRTPLPGCVEGGPIIPHFRGLPDIDPVAPSAHIGLRSEELAVAQPQDTQASDAPVLLSLVDGVATITFNRANAMNSLDVATKEALRDIVGHVADDPTVRCVVLTGTGRAFCVGQDLKEHVALLESGGSDMLFRTVPEHYNPIVTALATMPKPVI